MLRTICTALLLLALSSCTDGSAQSDASSKADRAAPTSGACRSLTPQDIEQASNASPVVDCSAKHTAETFTVGTFPADLVQDDPDDPALGGYVFDRCQRRFQSFLGGDVSLVLRSTMTWAWFRPQQGRLGRRRALVPLRRRRRRRAVQVLRRAPEDRQGAAARPARRPLAGLRRRSQRQRLGEDPVQLRRTPGARSPRSRSARPPTPTPATGSPRPAPATSAPSRSGRG